MKTDSICLPSTSSSRNFAVPSGWKCPLPDDDGRQDLELCGEMSAQLAAEIGHLREVGHAPLMDPLEDLPRVKTRVSQPVKGCFELAKFERRRRRRMRVMAMPSGEFLPLSSRRKAGAMSTLSARKAAGGSPVL